MDERLGKWRTVHFLDDRIEFRLSSAHLRGKIVGVIIVLFLLYEFSVVGQVGIGKEILVFVIVALIGTIVKLLCTEQKDNTITLMLDGKAFQTLKNERIIYGNTVKTVILRENTGRDIDDLKMAQVYLINLHSDYGILVYQDYIWRKSLEKTRTIAKNIASLIEVPLIENL